MGVCSGNHSEPCPRSSTTAASPPGPMASCVGNIATPVSIGGTLRSFRHAPRGELRPVVVRFQLPHPGLARVADDHVAQPFGGLVIATLTGVETDVLARLYQGPPLGTGTATRWYPCAGPLHLKISLQPAHSPEPTLVVVAAVAHIGPDFGMGEDQEPLLADRLDDRVGHLLGLEDGRHLLELLDRQLALGDHRRAHVLGA